MLRRTEEISRCAERFNLKNFFVFANVDTVCGRELTSSDAAGFETLERRGFNRASSTKRWARRRRRTRITRVKPIADYPL